MTIKVYLLAITYAALMLLSGSIVLNHITMTEKLDPLEMQFEAIVMDHLKNHTPYAGRIDKIITVRNEMLRNEKYLWLGTWSTGDNGTNAVYLKATWLPEDVYGFAWRVANFGPRNTSDVIIEALIYIVPLIAYIGMWAVVVAFTQMLRQR